MPPLVKQPNKILIGFLGSSTSADFTFPICEEISAGDIISLPVGWDLIRPAGKGDPYTWFVNAAVAGSNDRNLARLIGHDDNNARPT